MASITAIILSKNEESNIGNCINSIKDLCERIVVVDSGSTDKTIEISKQLGAEVLCHEFEYYAKQWNWGMENAKSTSEWLLRIDADEQFTKELNDEIKRSIQNCPKNVNGFVLSEWYYFLGKRLRYCSGNKRKLMLFRNGFGYIEDRKRDAHTLLKEGKSLNIKARFLHYDFKSIDNFIKKYNWYATREMQDYVSYIRGKNENNVPDKVLQNIRKKKFGIYYKAPMFWRAHWLFLYKYLFKGGFLDGKEGLMFTFFECYWYRFLVDSKIYEFLNNENSEFEELKALD